MASASGSNSDAVQPGGMQSKFLQKLNLERSETSSSVGGAAINELKLATISVPDNLTYCYAKQYEKEKGGCYPMEHTPRGRALVVTMTGNREGWENDVKELHRMFLYLDVRPDYRFDLKGQELLKELEDFAANKINEHFDCLFVCLMGHGGKMDAGTDNRNKEFLKTADDQAFFVREGLVFIFNNTKYPHLLDKPKVFIVQMCRGVNEEGSVAVPSKTTSDASRDPETIDSVVIPTDQTGSQTLPHPVQETGPAPVALPERKTASFTDYLFGFATQPGLKSYRQINTGAWYIQELSRVVMEKAADKQFTNILEDVNSHLEKVAVGRPGAQVGEMVSGLKKALLLFPGLQKEDKPPKTLEPAERVRALSAETDPEIQSAYRVLGLPEGRFPYQALLTNGFNDPFKVMTVDQNGFLGKPFFKCKNAIHALVRQDNKLVVLESSGHITRCSLDDPEQVTETWDADVGSLWDAAELSHNELLLVDSTRGEVSTFSLEPNVTQRKEVKLSGLDFPNSVTCFTAEESSLIAVTEQGKHHVLIYDSTWQRIATVGGQGAKDGKFRTPRGCVFLPSGNLLVSDSDNHRVTEMKCTADKQFVRHWLTAEDNVKHPGSASFMFPYLWIVLSPGQQNVSKYQIFDQ